LQMNTGCLVRHWVAKLSHAPSFSGLCYVLVLGSICFSSV
jgi:hypothetical protein